MSKKLPVKYYRQNKERQQKKLVKDIKIFLKKELQKSDNMVVNTTKISQKMENKSLMSTEWQKQFIIIIRNYNFKKQ